MADGETPLDDAFVFYLGVFLNGFVPTPANTEQWAANWQSVDAVSYKAQYGSFSARHTTTEDDPAAGSKGYIWGVRRNLASSEWFLVTDESWLWPDNDLFGLKVSWMVAEASTPILGSINGADYQLQTVAVTDPLPTVDFEIWRKRFFPDTTIGSLAESHADADGDGISNYMEFALDLNPNGSETGIFNPVLFQF